jgi:peptidoglycan/LPS O-acetylase OafA/YrhL/lysophospholipase L1-like esterase
VVAYHLAPGLLPGGFLGVDIFFVLSGFLITSLLVAEADATRGIDLPTFYVRRARRLLPALLLLLIAVSGYAATLATVGELHRLREHALWALGYLANWKFILDGTTYTDLVAGASPLRHTWSLAIEEQFYVVFPLLVLLVGHLVAWRSSDLRRWLFVIAAAGSVASAAVMAALWGDGTDPSRGYFGTDTRAHALLVGVGLGAALVGRPPSVGPAARWAGRAGVAGTIVLAVCVAVAHETSSWLQHGGFLVVALAAGAIICSLGGAGPLQRLLATRALAGLGRISYGVYLWHWPVIVVVDEARTGVDGPALVLVRLALTLTISLASYWIIEQPARRGVVGARLGRSAGPVVGFAIVLLVVGVVASTSLRAGVGVTAAASTAPSTAAGVRPSRADRLPVTVVVLGDSVAHTLAGGVVGAFPEFQAWAPEQSPFDPSVVRLESAALPACSFLPGGVLVDGPRAADLSGFCGDWRAGLDDALTAHPSTVVLVALSNDAWDRRVDGIEVDLGTPAHDRLLYAFLDDVRTIGTRHDAEVALVALPPRVGRFVAKADADGHRERSLLDSYRTYASDRRDVRVLDLFDEICPDGDCDRPPAGYDPSWRYDGLHFSADGARWVAGWLTDALTTTR